MSILDELSFVGADGADRTIESPETALILAFEKYYRLESGHLENNPNGFAL